MMILHFNFVEVGRRIFDSRVSEIDIPLFFDFKVLLFLMFLVVKV